MSGKKSITGNCDRYGGNHHQQKYERATPDHDSNLDVPIYRPLLTCYAYEEEMVVEVNPDMAECASIGNNQDAGCNREQRGHYCSFARLPSQQAAEERTTDCHRPRETDSDQTPPHVQVTNTTMHHDAEINNQNTITMGNLTEENNCTHIQKSNHINRLDDYEQTFDQHIKQKEICKCDVSGREPLRAGILRCSRYSPQEKSKYNSSSSSSNDLQVEVEIEVGDSGATNVMQGIDVEGTVAINATLCQMTNSTRNNYVEDSSISSLKGNIRNAKRNITVPEMKQLDMCVDSNLQVTFKPNGSDNNHVNQREITDSSDAVMKNGTIFDGNFTLKENGELMQHEEHKSGQTTSKTGRRKVDIKSILPYLKAGNFVEGYEKKVIVKTERTSLGDYQKCPTRAPQETLKILIEENTDLDKSTDNQELLNYDDKFREIKDRTSTMEGRIFQSVLDDWRKRESRSDQVFKKKDPSGPDRWHNVQSSPADERGWNGRVSIPDRDNLEIIDSPSNDWYRSEPVPDDSNYNGLVSPVSDDWDEIDTTKDQDFAGRNLVSNSLDTIMSDLEKQSNEFVDHISENWNKVNGVPDWVGIEIKDSAVEEWKEGNPILDEDWDKQDPISNESEGREYKTLDEEGASGIDVPISDDRNRDTSTEHDKQFRKFNPTIRDEKNIHSYKDNHEVEKCDLGLDHIHEDQSMQFNTRMATNDDPAFTTRNTMRDASIPNYGHDPSVDPVMDYLKRGIFLQGEADNSYRERDLFTRLIGTDILADVGGIEASGFSNDDKIKEQEISETERNVERAMFEGLSQVPSFRSTLDETTTLLAQQSHMEYIWNKGHTVTYLGDRISYLQTPKNGVRMDGSTSSSSETVHSTGNNMLNEVSAILQQIDLPYISKVGSDIRNHYESPIVQTISKSAKDEEVKTHANDTHSLYKDLGESGMHSITGPSSTTMYSNKIVSNENTLIEGTGNGERDSFLSIVSSILDSFTPKLYVQQTTAEVNVNEDDSSTTDDSDTDESISDEERVEIPKVNAPNNKKIITQFMSSNDTFKRSFPFRSEAQPYGKHYTQRDEKGSFHFRNGDKPSYSNVQEHFKYRSNIPIKVSLHSGVSSNMCNGITPNKTTVNRDGKAIKKKSKSKQHGILPVYNVAKATLKPRNRKKRVLTESFNETMRDFDSSSSSSLSDTDTEVNERSANTNSAKRVLGPFERVRGYPTRLYPIALYSLCIFLVYTFWTACYFNCTYTSYGFARRSNTWYCRLYRYATEASHYSSELHAMEKNRNLFLPFKPW